MRNTLGPVFRALADPTRRWFVESMVDGPVRLYDAAEMFPLSLPTVLHHIRVLQECGLVDSWKEGVLRLYKLRPDGLLEAEAWMRQILWSGYRPRLGSLPQDWGLPRR